MQIQKPILIFAIFQCLSQLSYTQICMGTNDQAFKRGDSAVVCIQFPEAGKRMAFSITVDKFLALNLQGAYAFLSDSGKKKMDILTQCQKDDSKTQRLDYVQQIENGEPRIFSIFSIVIQLEEGKVKSVVWDNVCFSQTNCFTREIDSSYTDKNNFRTSCDTETDCDPKIYVSWIGTDSNGDYLTSGGMRLSRFLAYGVGDLYSQSNSAFNNVKGQF